MRTLIQRVQHASVTIDGQLKSKIGKGLLVLVGIEDRDTQEDIAAHIPAPTQPKTSALVDAAARVAGTK